MIDDAKGYSNRVVSQAQGNAERFKQVYAEYSKAPAVIRQRMYLDTMQQIYSRATKVFVDSKSSNNVVYLPLDKLVDANRQNANAAAAASGASGVAAGTAPSGANQPVGAAPTGVIGGTITQDARAESASAASAVTAQSAAPASAAASAAASGAAAQSSGDPSRSRDAFRSRSREDDTQ
jgi:membrane protease subunit HflK